MLSETGWCVDVVTRCNRRQRLNPSHPNFIFTAQVLNMIVVSRRRPPPLILFRPIRIADCWRTLSWSTHASWRSSQHAGRKLCMSTASETAATPDTWQCRRANRAISDKCCMTLCLTLSGMPMQLYDRISESLSFVKVTACLCVTFKRQTSFIYVWTVLSLRLNQTGTEPAVGITARPGEGTEREPRLSSSGSTVFQVRAAAVL